MNVECRFTPCLGFAVGYLFDDWGSSDEHCVFIALPFVMIGITWNKREKRKQ